MVLEIVVAATCSYGHCNEALESYYVYNPTFKERTEEIVSLVNNSLNSDVKEYVIPTAGFFMNKRLNFSVSKNDKIFIEFKNPTLFGLLYQF